MITRLETLQYQCLRHIEQDLDTFHVLVGPNASGKTTFLDAVAFLSDLVQNGLEDAVHARTGNLQDLLWQRRSDRFEIALELPVPEPDGHLFSEREYTRCRYEITIGLAENTGELSILAEKVLLLTDAHRDDHAVQESLFPVDGPAPSTLASPRVRGIKTIVNKVPGGNDKFYDETGAGWDPSFKLGPRRSALANLPEDETRFPVATWLKHTLADGVLRLSLNSVSMRRPCPPGQPRQLSADGANLPYVIAALKEKAPAALSAWVNHLRGVLPNLKTVSTIERPEDRHRYLIAQYENGLEVPSWMLSDGTLRLFALTLLSYLPDFEGICLIEEPENGIHPGAIETVVRALSAVPNTQILMTTHSPVVINVVEPDHLLCFDAAEMGATRIMPGIEHPTLSNWRSRTDLSALFAGGVLR